MAVSVVKRTRRKVTAPVITPITADIISIPKGKETKEEDEDESADPQPSRDSPVVESITPNLPVVSTVPPLIIDLTGDTTEEDEDMKGDEPPVVTYNDFVSNASSSSFTPFHLMPLLNTIVDTPEYNFEEVWQQSFDSMLAIQTNETSIPTTPQPDEEAVFHSTANRFISMLQESFFVRPKKAFNGREIGDNHFEISSECNHQRGEFTATWEDGSLVMHPWDNNTYSHRGNINQFINNQIQPISQPMTSITATAAIWRPSVFTPTTVPITPTVRRPTPPIFVPTTPSTEVPMAPVVVQPKPERITRPNPLLFRANQGFPKKIVQ